MYCTVVPSSGSNLFEGELLVTMSSCNIDLNKRNGVISSSAEEVKGCVDITQSELPTLTSICFIAGGQSGNRVLTKIRR